MKSSASLFKDDWPLRSWYHGTMVPWYSTKCHVWILRGGLCHAEKLFQKCSRHVPKMCQGWSKILPGMFQNVPKLFQKCSKDLFRYCGEVNAMLKKCSRHVPSHAPPAARFKLGSSAFRWDCLSRALSWALLGHGRLS